MTQRDTMSGRGDEAEGVPPVPSFSERLPAFFMVPLVPEKLAILVLLSVASLAGFFIPLPRGFGVLLVEMAIWFAAFKHAFPTMDLIAHGHVDAAAQADAVRDDPARRALPWMMAGVLTACFAVFGVAWWIKGVIGVALSPVLAVAVPAIAMQLCASGDLGKSLPPARWWHVIRSLGAAYLVLSVPLLLLMNAVPRAIEAWVPTIGGFFVVPVITFAMLYLNLVSFALMGYLMYQFHRALGVAVDVLPGEEAREEKPKVNPEAEHDARVGTLLAAGQAEAAVEYAENLVRKGPDHWPAYERQTKLLGYLKMHDALHEHKKRTFALAMKLGRTANAFQLYKELVEDKDPPPLLGHHVLPLAKAAERAYDFALAIQIVRDFEEHFPGHPDIPGVVFFRGRLALERLHDEKIAREHFMEMLDRHYRSELAVEAKRYLQVIERMAPKKKPGGQGAK